MNNQILKYLSIALLLGVSGIFFTLVWHAVTDFVVFRPALWRDEAITYDGIRPILHPESFMSFMKAVLDGNDHRYGRILFNISAALSFIPERIWGIPGQIVTTRLTQAVFLFGSYLVLVFSFLRNWPLRVVGVLLFLCVPTTFYFSYMPKPEPIQIFFLALFLVAHFRRNYRFGWHWILLGLSQGAKVSTFPLVLAFIGVSFWLHRQKYGKIEFPRPKDPRLIAILGFAIGLILAVPVIIRGIFSYISQTFLGAGHGSDNSVISWIDWTRFLLTDYIGIPWIVSVSISVIGLFILWTGFKEWRRSDDLYSQSSQGVFLWLLGMILFLSIMVPVKRLWPHYLHAGVMLQILGLLMMIEFLWRNYSKAKRILGALFIAGLLSSLCWFGGHKNWETYIEASHRSMEPIHIERMKQYNYMMDLIDQLASALHRKPRVHFDPVLYVPEESPDFTRFIQWGGFRGWNEEYDLIFLQKDQTPDAPPIAPTVKEYKEMSQAHADYLKHVMTPEETNCLERPCYRLIKKDYGDFYALVWDQHFSKLPKN